LFKGGASMEAMAQVKAVAMDKTGTVTKGDFAVQEITGGGELLSLCAGWEQYSTHPIALSILAAARAQNLSLPTPEKVDELSGRGIRAVVDGKTILCGNQKLMAEHGVPVQDEAGTVVYVAVEGEYAGAIRIADTIKPHGDAAVKRLQDMGISVSMLTGDSAESANAVASATGIPTVFAKLLPQEKLEVLQTLRARHGATMFVGDGINDAPVLAGADVGAAMGSGADAAIEAADVVYMTSDIGAIPDSLGIARQTKAIAWQNVVFALAVKAAVMVLGLLGYASMWMAVFADSGVAMLCVLNAIRLLYRKR
jgi:Cd2+/Zn2+-exporting ATPase